MAVAAERIVVQTTLQEKRRIARKARKLGLPISELMLRGAAHYNGQTSDPELERLAKAVQSGAQRAAAATDNALDFIARSNRRIDAMEAKHARAMARHKRERA